MATMNPIVKLVVFGVIYGAYYFLVFSGSKTMSSRFILSTIAAYVTYVLIDMILFGGALTPTGWVEKGIFAFFSISLIAYALYMAYTHY